MRAFLAETIADRLPLDQVDPGLVEWFLDEAARNDPSYIGKFVLLMASYDWSDQLHRIRCPTLVVVPGAEPIGSTANYEPFRRLVKDVEMRVYEGAPHNICDAFPDRCAGDVLDFLRAPFRTGRLAYLGEIRREVGTDAGEDRSFGLRQGEAFTGDGFVYPDIKPRRFQDDFVRDLRQRVAVGVATLADPAPHKILVEALGGLPGGEPALIAVADPIPAAVRSVDLVGEDDPALGVKAEFVFGIDEDQAALAGDFPPAREQRQRQLRRLSAIAQPSAICDRVISSGVSGVVVAADARLGRRSDDRCRQFLVFAQPVRKSDAVDLAPARLVHRPDRCAVVPVR